MDVSVGLVSGTTFRVPSPAVRETFGPGTLSMPLNEVRGVSSPSSADGRRQSGGTIMLGARPVSPAMARRAQAILEEEDALTSFHRLPYPPVVRPEPLVDLPADGPVDADEPRPARGARWFDVGKRRAKDSDEADRVLAAIQAQQAEEQRRREAWWDALCANDPETVTAQLGSAFKAAGLPATTLAVHGGYVEIAVLAPEKHVLPTQSVTLVQSRGLSIRMSSSERRNALRRQVLSGIVIASVRCALAAAPGIETVRTVAVRAAHRGHYADLSPVTVVDIDRRALEGIDLGHRPEALLTRIGNFRRGTVPAGPGVFSSLSLEDVPEVAPLFARLCRYADADHGPQQSATSALA